MSIVLITGSNRGIGQATALHLAEKGHRVFASMRNTDKADDLRIAADEKGLSLEYLQLDVTDDASVKTAVSTVLDQEGRIDVLINNAGIGPVSPLEEMDDAAFRAVFETNYFGAIRVTRAVLPSMRANKNGTIVNISSVAARVAAECMGAYSATKWALEASSEALAQELVPHGIRVVLIEPGITHTDMADGIPSQLSGLPGSAYAPAAQHIHAIFSGALQAGSTTPEEVAHTIEEALNDAQPRLRYPVGDGARAFVEGRARMNDEDWIAMGRHTTVEDYFQEFAMRFPPPSAAEGQKA
ncbi:MAG TPA: SDR family oxidoreductase [Pyrinomonadaceae bacterium]|nr:SDR family oxidoreductase [Pyrinomonadaceae bacterium]HMP65898.1 SDR family oxidoreductase [Pyrinomonadaceae bacterium]